MDVADARELNDNYLNEIFFDANNDIEVSVISTVPDRSVMTNPVLSTSSQYRDPITDIMVRTKETASRTFNSNNNNRVVE